MHFPGKAMLTSARDKGIALCGIDVFNMECARAVIRAAEALNVPVFLQAGVDSINYMGMRMAGQILAEAKRSAKVEVCIHMDHGRETSRLDQLKNVMDAGFESVMADGSALPVEENIVLCRAVVAMAHPRGICVEAELGRVSRDLNATREEIERLMTDPDQAGMFVEKTGADYLAVSVGSISGFRGERAGLALDLKRLERIARNVPCPLVFHGGTGIPEDQLQEAIKLGVSKVNVAHGFWKAFLDGFASHLDGHPDEFDPRRPLSQASAAAEAFARKKMEQITLLKKSRE